MVSDKYRRYCDEKGRLPGQFAGQRGLSGRVCQSSYVDLGRSVASRRCLTPVWRVLGAVRPRLTCEGASD